MQCVDNTVLTSGLPPYNFVWSNGETGQTINVCPTQTTTYSVVADASGCVSSPDSVTVNVVDVQCGRNHDKILFCHIPPGNPSKAKTLCIDADDVAGHLAHGDYLGSCAPFAGKRSGQENSNNNNSKTSTLDYVNEFIFDAYPNPASGYTFITFKLPFITKTTLSVYNITGEKLLTLFETITEQSTTYNLIFNSKRLASGVYYYKLVTENDVYNKKLVVVK